HHKCCILISEPAKRGERYHSIRPDYDQAFETMPYPWKAGLAAVCSDTILKNEVTTIHTHTDAVPKESHDSVVWDSRFWHFAKLRSHHWPPEILVTDRHAMTTAEPESAPFELAARICHCNKPASDVGKEIGADNPRADKLGARV